MYEKRKNIFTKWDISSFAEEIRLREGDLGQKSFAFLEN